MFQVSMRRSFPSFRNSNFKCMLRWYLSKPEHSLCATVATNNGTKHSRSWTTTAATRGRSTGGKTIRGDISCSSNNADWFQDPFLCNVWGNVTHYIIYWNHCQSLVSHWEGSWLSKQLSSVPLTFFTANALDEKISHCQQPEPFSRSFVVSLILDSKNSGYLSSQRYIWHWEKFSKKDKHTGKRPLCKLRVPTLTCIHYDKQFKIIWATVSSLPASRSATQLKEKKISPLYIKRTHT